MFKILILLFLLTIPTKSLIFQELCVNKLDTNNYNFLNNIDFVNNPKINLTKIVPKIQNDKVILINGGGSGFPSIKILDNGTYNYINGGLPQLVNYTAFNKSLTNTILSHKKNFNGYIVLDMESWIPVWDGISGIYKNETIKYIRTLFPQINSTELLNRAQQSWEMCSMDLMIYAIKICRNIYPTVSIGYYGLPNMPYFGNESSFKHYEHINDQMYTLWQQVDVLLPSIYQFFDSTNNGTVYINNIDYIDRKLKESIRIRKNLMKIGLDPKPIYPYAWHRYHGGIRFLSECDVYTEFFLPILYEANGVDGIILWGHEKNQTVQNETLEFFKNYSYLFNIL